jgi:hypothetical protein
MAAKVRYILKLKGWGENFNFKLMRFLFSRGQHGQMTLAALFSPAHQGTVGRFQAHHVRALTDHAPLPKVGQFIGAIANAQAQTLAAVELAVDQGSGGPTIGGRDDAVLMDLFFKIRHGQRALSSHIQPFGGFGIAGDSPDFVNLEAVELIRLYRK